MLSETIDQKYQPITQEGELKKNNVNPDNVIVIKKIPDVINNILFTSSFFKKLFNLTFLCYAKRIEDTFS